jgi:hypothetical protein
MTRCGRIADCVIRVATGVAFGTVGFRSNAAERGGGLIDVWDVGGLIVGGSPRRLRSFCSCR